MPRRATKGAASAASTLTAREESNVVRLPTAAPRMVHQRWNKDTREARKALRRFPGEYISHERRNALKDAAILRDMDRTGVAMALALATFDAMPADTKQRIRKAIIERGKANDFGPLAVLLEQRNFGQQWDLLWAMDRLAGRG